MSSDERGSSGLPCFALGLGIGVAVGALAGLLLAPKPGKETREELLEKARKAAEELRNRIEELKARVEEGRDEGENLGSPEVSEGGL